MKFTYQTATGDVTIDVPEDWHEILVEEDKKIAANDKKETRRHFHIEQMQYEGSEYGYEDTGIEEVVGEDNEVRTSLSYLPELGDSLMALNEKRRNLIQALFFEGVSGKEYAARMHVTEGAITGQKQTALKKMKNFLEKT